MNDIIIIIILLRAHGVKIVSLMKLLSAFIFHPGILQVMASDFANDTLHWKGVPYFV